MKTPLVFLELLHSSRQTHILRGHFAVNASNTLCLNVIGDEFLKSHKFINVYFFNAYVSYCTKPFKDEAQTTLFKYPVRTAL